MLNMSSELASVYATLGDTFTFETVDIKLMKDESFDVDNSNQEVYRGIATDLVGVTNGSILTHASMGAVKVISATFYGDYDEEKLITFMKV